MTVEGGFDRVPASWTQLLNAPSVEQLSGCASLARPGAAHRDGDHELLQVRATRDSAKLPQKTLKA